MREDRKYSPAENEQELGGPVLPGVLLGMLGQNGCKDREDALDANAAMKPTPKPRKAAKCRECGRLRKMVDTTIDRAGVKLAEKDAEIERLNKECAGLKFENDAKVWQVGGGIRAMLDVLARSVEKASWEIYTLKELDAVRTQHLKDLTRDRDESSKALAEYVKSMAAYKGKVADLIIALSGVRLKIPHFSEHQFTFTSDKWRAILRMTDQLEREGRT